MNRILITGIGAVTPIGHGARGLWEGVLAERSAVSALDRFPTEGYGSRIAGQIHDFAPDPRLDRKRLKRLDRFSALALTAGLGALDDAGLAPGDVDPNRAGVCAGTALGCVGCAEEENDGFRRTGPRGLSATLALSVFGGAGGCNLAIELGWTGYVTANSDSCASGPIALGNAMNALRRGDADVMLAGAAEAPLFPMTFAAFDVIRAMSRRNDDPTAACRPFDAGRDGFVMAEGAAFLILETERHAARRGARAYAELAGFGLSNDAFHMAAPRPDGAQAARAMSAALCDGGFSPDEVDYVNAHGSSTPLNDPSETLAIRRALGARADAVPVSSTKAMTGHAIGATGAMEAAVCALALHHGWIPPTVNLETPGEGCDLPDLPRVGRAARLRGALSNSFGFGGINAALAFRSL